MNVNSYLSGINFDVYVVYRYPGTRVISFCEELTDILENNITKTKGHLLLLGDVNIHLDNQDLPGIITFQDCMGLLWVNKSYQTINAYLKPYTGLSNISARIQPNS